MRTGSIRVAVLPLIAAILTIGAQAQILFTAETPVAPTRPGCIQVGLFLSDTGMNHSWSQLMALVEYTADVGVLAGQPEARLTDFGVMTQPGLTNPGTPQLPHMPGSMSMCTPMNITNSVVLNNGMPIPFMSGGGQGAMVMLSETISPMSMHSGRITLLADGFFITRPMEDQLFAILTFPVTGNPGEIQVRFPMAPDSNGLVDTVMMMHNAMTADGGARFESPSSHVPTLSQWGIIAFLVGLFLSGLFLLRRRPITG